MRIRNKIAAYFSTATLLITGTAFILIYLLFSQNREEEFQMRQKEKISTSLKLLAQIRQTDSELIEDIDRLTINDLYDEKLLLFDENKQLIYSSIDDTPVPFSRRLLATLNPDNKWVETKDGLYDVVGTYLVSNGKTYYGISKAFDAFGYSKLRYLKYVLVIAFICISIIIFLVSLYFSKKITKPLVAVTKRIASYNFESEYAPVEVSGKDEIFILAQQFNRLMKRINEVYAFQKHAIHHISHELKTPVAILVSNFERIENETDTGKIKAWTRNQKEDTKSLSKIINALLEIAKAEAGNVVKQNNIRIDELIFDVADELKNIYPDFQFYIEYEQAVNEENLVLKVNARLIKSAILNLMQNTIQYSNDGEGKILIGHANNIVQVTFENRGNIIKEDEIQYLFQHFFRGENSKGKRGFGLGLVLVSKIISLHDGRIFYRSAHHSINTFVVTLPLS